MPKIKIVPYNPNWPLLFKQEAEKIKSALGDTFIAIYHIGSTSVEGLTAKPKIDIIAEVSSLNFSHKRFTLLDYEYRGAFNLPLQKSFTYRSKALNVNLHIFEENDPEIELNLRFRDYLRTHYKERDRYAKLKHQLIEDELSHKKCDTLFRGYTLGKHYFIQKILKKSGFNRLRFVICAHYSEWDAAKDFRNKYFFKPNNIKDPYEWTFKHPDHKHLILYEGVSIVGYAHVQLWSKNRAAIRIIVIKEEKRENNYGRKFMSLIEKWLKQEDYKSIHTESSPKALGFYEKLGYSPMPFNDPDNHQSCCEDIAMGKAL